MSLAENIAEEAHRGQTDKSSQAYIDHPRRVAERVTSSSAKATAWLHDVLEDTPTTASDLLDAGIPAEVVQAVEALTKRDGDTTESYLARIAEIPLAVEVKLADMADNSDADRLAHLDQAVAERLKDKYEGYRRTLKECGVSL